ncbi:FG-GAP-like repeat-containing protein [Stieleria sp. ICT_E10.1]|uniref:FG-GAP-like repeat-containing protein n=1 Tax=Stieleria sedimenti TaxID=2976331 RepID=UPI00217F6A2A|nr:FG-GAP-like repeat-containing protein [Stieleria sedimenti]MCS7467062.1 FG-GAP-like repeat-containing protein [Stieleria sedimenti]
MAWRSSTIGASRILIVSLIGLATIGCEVENRPSMPSQPSAGTPQRERPALAADQDARQHAAKTATPTSLQEQHRQLQMALRAGDWGLVERIGRQMIERFPDAPDGYRLSAQLLSSQGRRQEAATYVRTLLKMGVADAREVLSLIDVSTPFRIVSFDQWIDPSQPGLFALGQARRAYVADNEVDEALAILETLRREFPGHTSVEAFYGRVLAEANRLTAFVRWLEDVPDGIEGQSDYWVAVGTWLQGLDRDRESIAALARAVEIDPSDRRALRLMIAALSRTGQDQRAAAVQASLSKLDAVFRKAAQADANDALEIGAALESLVRPWEALGWYKIATERGAGGASQLEKLRLRAAAVRKWERESTASQIARARTEKLLGFDPGDYPLPEPLLAIERDASKSVPADKSPLMFRDVAHASGIRTSFVSDYNLQEVDFYLHQANGGGLALLDFDRDGKLDVYVVQSGGDPNIANDSLPNELYRQTAPVAFTRVDRNARCDGRGYGQGVCAADVNQDGFADLLVANIGRNEVLINQGDGTFRDVTSTHLPAESKWTSCIGVGDLDGDQIPDLVEVNYVDDPAVFERKCQGELIACVPQSFRPAVDRFLKADRRGRFSQAASLVGDAVQPNYGFGLVIADFDGRPGNEVFVGNDGDLNQYYRGGLSSGSPLDEMAGISGLAVGASGVAAACMGIASGDFDRAGRLDLAITNFYKEPMNLFLQSPSGAFVDDAMRRGLDVSSRSVLGFGCQAADLDNDGWLDLAVLNGHLYDYRQQGIPFRMPPQLFRGSPKRFELEQVSEDASYFAVKRLGRTLVQGDLDRDGRVDMVANHLDAPVALLLNQSKAGNWLQVQLVGRMSERDAVGAIVEIQYQGETFSSWMTGGDGYMCSNEPLLHFGIAGHRSIDQLTVRWPNGDRQTFDDVPINRRVLLIEGLGDVFSDR